jgi:hypothetical protein
VISRHLRNIYKTRELEQKSTVAFFATVQSEGGRRVERRIEFYNLDAILSVGYRVNSKRGTQFRIWATKVLREHILRGYSVNERRLKELNQAIRLIADVAERRTLTGEEATALLRVVADYSLALDLLDAYDRQAVAALKGSRGPVEGITVEEARQTVKRLREHYGAGSLFGRERDASLAGSLRAVFQTFDNKDLYPSLEENRRGTPLNNSIVGSGTLLTRLTSFSEIGDKGEGAPALNCLPKICSLGDEILG